jgi:IclR family acetate operon transcriptional repressor
LLPAPPATNPEAILSTLDNGLRVLEILAADGSGEGLTLTDLAKRMSMHRTTVFRLLATLRPRGYISRDPRNDRYRLGIKLLALASALQSQLDLRQISRPLLVALRDQSGELVHLTILDGDDVVTIDRIEGTQSLSLQTEMGARRPMYCTASGKAILGSLSIDEVKRILALGMSPVTPTTITNVETMLAQLSEVQKRGYAWDDEERILGVRCVAAPVFAHDRRVLGAVSIAAPAIRMPWERVWKLGEEVRAAADAISRQFGYVD